MGVLDWFRRNGAGKEDPRLTAWRIKWTAAASTGDTTARAALARELESLGVPDDDAEIEREMLEALERLEHLRADVEATGLPRLETGHRVVGLDVCHFIGPVSMPDEAAQPSGRLLLTSARAIFVGGANGSAVPWHAVTEVAHAERDLLLARADRQQHYRFRCNSFADALCAAFLARELMERRRRPASGL